MKIRIRMLGFFRRASLFTKLYIVIYLLIMFSGSTVIRDQVSNLIALLVGILACMTFDRRFGHSAIFNKKDRLPFFIMMVFSCYLLWQMLYIAYVPTIAWTYVKRYMVFSMMLIFLPQIELALCAVKFSKYYAFIVACSIILSTIITGNKSGGLVGDYQAAGMMMSISCILFIMDYFNDTNEKKNLVGIVLSISGLFMSGKRMFALIVMFSFVLIYILSEKKNKRIRFWGAIILLVISISIIYTLIPSVRELFMRFSALSGSETTMTSGRNVLWEKATDIFNAHRLYGIGFGAFQTYFADHYNISGIQAFLTHNIYYGLLAETGLIGFCLYIFFMIYILLKSVKLWRKTRKIENSNIVYLCTYSILMQIWFIIYGYTGNGIYDANESFFYFSSIAMILSIDNNIIISKQMKTKGTV